MNSRKKTVDKEAARQLRAELYAAIDLGELGLQEAVKRMRTISRLTQPEFAARVGVSAKVVKEIERGIGNPTTATLNQIGQFFGLEVAFVRSDKLNGAPRSPASSAPVTATNMELMRLLTDVQSRLSDLEAINNANRQE